MNEGINEMIDLLIGGAVFAVFTAYAAEPAFDDDISDLGSARG